MDTANMSDYSRRVWLQTKRWAMGFPQHDHKYNECCPDFSCCNPELFVKNAKHRWAHYDQLYGERPMFTGMTMDEAYSAQRDLYIGVPAPLYPPEMNPETYLK